eukprot:scaffold616_cov306-Pavlova_lutheri.AAC.6
MWDKPDPRFQKRVAAADCIQQLISPKIEEWCFVRDAEPSQMVSLGSTASSFHPGHPSRFAWTFSWAPCPFCSSASLPSDDAHDYSPFSLAMLFCMPVAGP